MCGKNTYPCSPGTNMLYLLPLLTPEPSTYTGKTITQQYRSISYQGPPRYQVLGILNIYLMLNTTIIVLYICYCLCYYSYCIYSYYCYIYYTYITYIFICCILRICISLKLYSILQHRSVNVQDYYLVRDTLPVSPNSKKEWHLITTHLVIKLIIY